MYTITHIYKNIIKNRIKDKIKTLTDDLIDNIVDNIGSSNNYVSTISYIQDSEREMIKHLIVSIFHELDFNFKNSKERLKNYTISKSNVSRTITTIFGDITFYRTYYKSRFSNSYHFVLDELLDLHKYDRYDPVVKAYAIDNYTKTNQALSGKITGNQISSINELINDNKIHSIPRQSIHNWINKWNVPEDTYKPRETPEILYIMVDEKFLGCQNLPNDIMVKSYVVFENILPISKNRNSLVNRLVFNTADNTPWVKFSDFLYKIYDPTKIKKIFLLSDGGRWITANFGELRVEKNITIKHLLCEFHFKQSINRITSIKEERNLIFSFFHSLNKNDFLSVLYAFKSKYHDRSNIIDKQINYISNYYGNIKAMLKSNIGSSMESHISHIVASPFSSRPKGFSSLKINKYLMINDLFNNGKNLFNLYLSSYNNLPSPSKEFLRRPTKKVHETTSPEPVHLPFNHPNLFLKGIFNTSSI